MAHIRTHQILAITALLLMAVLLAACKPGDPGRSTGAYPIDIFQEMHYNQTYKAQEPPRYLPPEGAFPIEGGFIPVSDIEDLDTYRNVLGSGDEVVEWGALLYRQNCSACHGLNADGASFVGDRLLAETGTRPPALNDLSGRTPSSLFSIISGGGNIMPAFEGLLTQEDRWALVALLETTAERRSAALGEANETDEPSRTLRLLQLRGITE